MRIIVTFYLFIYFTSCTEKKLSINGHWHESINGETIHCYKLTDSTYSVDELSIGFKKPHNIIDGKKAIFLRLSMDYSTNYKVGADNIQINDSIDWIRASDNEATFLNDLTLGLLVSLEPHELNQRNYDLPYNVDFAKFIIVGKLKSNQIDDKHHIQINDKIVPLADIMLFLIPHHNGNLENSIVVINADKDSPKALLDSIKETSLKVGYLQKNIYKTAINKTKRTIGLVKYKQTTANNL